MSECNKDWENPTFCGIPLAEATRILKAYNDKRIIELPCRLGDTMYDISEFVNCIPCPEMYEDKVSFITIMNRKNGEVYFDIECVECDYGDFGKTIFFTKEEAEQALSKLQASYEQVTRKEDEGK